MPVVVNGSTYAGAENAQDAAHTRKKTAKCSGIELVSARLLPINREATHKCFS